MTTTLTNQVITNFGVRKVKTKTKPVISTSKFSHLEIIFCKDGEIRIYNKLTGRYED